MTKIDIFSGFLGAGKTTLIKKLIEEAYQGEKLVLIENEFGEIGIDGGFLQDAGVEITEMNSGCICCSLVGDFGQALEQVLFQYHPDRIIIEPSGVGKLSDVIGAVQRLDNHDITLNAFVTVADATKCKIYMKNFGEFYNNQIEHAATIVLSRTGGMKEEKLLAAVALLREHNANAPIITTPWEELDGKQILEAMENKDSLKEELARLAAEQAEHDEAHHHHHHDHDHEHEHEEHEHPHDHDEHCHDGEHHHGHDEHCHEHPHDEHCHEHSHDEHHSEHDGHCHEHHHDHHDHHGHHHADEVFTSWGRETGHKYSQEEITEILRTLSHSEEYGIILRAKGILPCPDDSWLQFDLVPEEYQVRSGAADYTGKICVIGTDLKEEKLKELFRL